MTANYEETQRGNPHQLTVRQHCFPTRSIERFANDDGRIHVHLVPQETTVPLKPNDRVFCALRAWDQKAESGWMKDVEDAYQELADEIACDKIMRRLKEDEKQVITDMYVLWNYRWHWSKNPVEDQSLMDISEKSPFQVLGLSQEYSKDDQELLEKAGVTAIRPDLTIPGRYLTAANLQQNFLKERRRNYTWGVLTCKHAEFIVPDHVETKPMLPVTPHICFVNQEGYRFANEWTVARMNESSRETSEAYYFGRSL